MWTFRCSIAHPSTSTPITLHIFHIYTQLSNPLRNELTPLCSWQDFHEISEADAKATQTPSDQRARQQQPCVRRGNTAEQPKDHCRRRHTKQRTLSPNTISKETPDCERRERKQANKQAQGLFVLYCLNQMFLSLCCGCRVRDRDAMDAHASKRKGYPHCLNQLLLSLCCCCC
jgi:hypothetical protein